MPAHTAASNPADIRNIALTGQSGSGKTTLTERLLFLTSTIDRMGTVEDGNTVSDWTDEERHHTHSLQPSVVHFRHEDHTVNLIDTPGLPDFVGQAIGCFPAVGTVAVVLDAAKGIETVSRRMMTVAGDRRLPRMIIVNKIDQPDVDLEALVASIQEAFGSVCLPISLPTADRTGVINVFEEDHAEDQSPLFSSVEDAHTRIIDQVVEVNEALMTEYLEKGAAGLDKAKVHDAFEQALREAHLVPICFVSGREGHGAEDLLHVFASLLPSPLETNPRTFLRDTPEGQEAFHPVPDPGMEVLAHVFKVSSDPFVGKLGMFHVHQGTLRTKSELYYNDLKKPVRVGHLFKLQGKDHVEVDEVGPGDIAAVAKLDELAFDGVFHSVAHEDEHIRLLPLPMPKPMYGLAVELKNHKDESKFAPAIAKLQAEDPCFVVERIAATKQTVMRGMGELHLRVVQERLKDQFGIELVTTPPKIAYKETITKNAEGHHRHKKQSGGSGEFGEVKLRVAPLPGDHATGFEFENATVGGSVPRQFMPAIEKGVRQALEEGAIAGYPITGVRVEVFDGKHHAVDSKEIAFVKAGKRAFVDAVQNAGPALLEPFVHVEVTAPSQYMGDITGDLSTKRGQVQDTDMIGADVVIIRAAAPMGELQNYSNELKSMTGGTGSFSMDYSHDERTPPHVQQEVVDAYDPHHEDD